MTRWISFLLLACGCLEPWPENELFPCREPADCADGFECDPSRFVCVPAGSVDAGARD